MPEFSNAPLYFGGLLVPHRFFLFVDFHSLTLHTNNPFLWPKKNMSISQSLAHAHYPLFFLLSIEWRSFSRLVPVPWLIHSMCVSRACVHVCVRFSQFDSGRYTLSFHIIYRMHKYVWMAAQKELCCKALTLCSCLYVCQDLNLLMPLFIYRRNSLTLT